MRVQRLDRTDRQMPVLERCNAFHRGARSGHRGDALDAVRDSGAADRLLVEPWFSAMRRINDELDTLALDEIDHVGPAFLHLEHAFDDESCRFNRARRTAGRDDLETQFRE